jgi:hypothetical protein
MYMKLQYNRWKPCVALALLASVWIARPTEAAIITILHDSTTVFSGTFELTGTERVPHLRPVHFVHFPTDVSMLEPAGILIERGTTTARLLTNDPGGGSLFADRGNPDDPCVIFSTALPFGPLAVSGSYANSLPILFSDLISHAFAGGVDWAYANLSDTGGPNGTFSGSFSFRFTPSSNHVPEGGASAVMLGLGVLGLSGFGKWLNGRRRCRGAGLAKLQPPT